MVMERNESRLMISLFVELSERSMKKDLDSGEEVKGSMDWGMAELSSGLKRRKMLTSAFRDDVERTHPPFGADGVCGPPVVTQASPAEESESVFEFLRILENLLVLGFADADDDPAFSSPDAKGMRSKSRDEKATKDERLLSLESTAIPELDDDDPGLDIIIETGLRVCLR